MDTLQTNPQASQRLAPWLWLLTALFALRVVAQPLSLIVDLPGLPSFAQWHSALLPYGLLLTAQIFLLAVMARTAWWFSHVTVHPRTRLGHGLIIFGRLYLALMLLRLLLGLTVFTESIWFTRHLPTFFHFVLASFVLLVGHFHRSRAPLSLGTGKEDAP